MKNDGVNVQNIDSTNYLAMHVAAQKVLQKNEGNYNIAVIDSCVSAFKFLCDTGFDNKKSVDNLLDDSSYNKYKNDPILKFTGDARKTINTALFGNDDDDKKFYAVYVANADAAGWTPPRLDTKESRDARWVPLAEAGGLDLHPVAAAVLREGGGERREVDAALRAGGVAG